MSDINSVILTGRLADDVTTNETGKVARGTLAVNHWNGEEETTQFLDFKILGERQCKVVPYLTKGRSITLAGELNREVWEKEGTKRSAVYVYARNIVLGSTPANNSNSSSTSGSAVTAEDITKPITVDDIPF